jgi:geranylgeranyl diphosphate synthase type II
MIAMLTKEKNQIDEKIKETFQEVGDLPMYHMLRYFMGYENNLKKPSEGKHGKRTRSALLLMVSNMFGGSKSALDLAVGIELFHNFTLIHDDIVDNDEMRRGQPTVWKNWGVDHAINSGDAQLLITNHSLLNASLTDTENGARFALLLNSYFLEVCEGQYLDFELTKKKLNDETVTESAYFEMIRKKTAVLVGAATAVGAQSAGCHDAIVEKMYMYGESLGFAYQIVDDLVSVWVDSEKTGKSAYGDIYERKKTYPVLYTLKNGNKKRLVELYEKKEPLHQKDVQEVIALFESAGAKEATKKLAQTYAQKASDMTDELPLEIDSKEKLVSIVEKVMQTAGTLGKNTV